MDFWHANSPWYQSAAEARGKEMLYILNRSPAPVTVGVSHSLDNSQLNIQSSRSCLGLVNQVSEKLWEKRVELFVPTMIGKSKWKKEGIGTLR